MKKSEILRSLNKDDFNNVKNYYRYEKDSFLGRRESFLIVYVIEITWEHIKEWGENIIDITASEENDDTIRISIDNIEWD